MMAWADPHRTVALLRVSSATLLAYRRAQVKRQKTTALLVLKMIWDVARRDRVVQLWWVLRDGLRKRN